MTAKRDGIEAAQAVYDARPVVYDNGMEGLKQRFYLDMLVEDGLVI